ncbi:MAG: hypothetical protein KGJ00_17990 [Bradyrhizobium sp.]|nr:hypothetical protein [Bradyrhizobium sp.]
MPGILLPLRLFHTGKGTSPDALGAQGRAAAMRGNDRSSADERRNVRRSTIITVSISFRHSAVSCSLALREPKDRLMPDSVFRANIDHFLETLDDSDLAPESYAAIVKRLVEEEDKLGRYQEQLEFAESRAANGRSRLDRLRWMRDGEVDAAQRAGLDRLIATFELTQRLLDNFCRQLRRQAATSPL